MTALDWGIVAFVLLLAAWGYQHGLIVGALSLVGFAIGALVGSRIGPALLPEGSHSPYAPATALLGATMFGGIVAVSLEGIGQGLRTRLVRGSGAAVLDGAGGAVLLGALALGLAWLFGAVALNTPGGGRDLRQVVQRSAVLRELNGALPPSGFIINALHRIDPGVAINGPDADVGPPDSRIAGDPDVDAAGNAVVKVLGTACGLGVEGSGWVVAPGLVVTNAHVVAGEQDTTVTLRDGATELDASPVHYEPGNDLAILRVDALEGPGLRTVDETESGTAGAVLGFPENGGFTVTPARLGPTAETISEDSYGRGPVRRDLSSLRGDVRSGNSGGPMVDAKGRVLTTVFAATTTGKPGGYGIPNDVIRAALDQVGPSEVSTGPCT